MNLFPLIIPKMQMEHVNLTPDQQDYLEEFTRKGSRNVREVNRAYMLLWLAKGKKMAEIEDLLAVERTAIKDTLEIYQTGCL